MKHIDRIQSEKLVNAILRKDNVAASEQLERILRRKCAAKIYAAVSK